MIQILLPPQIRKTEFAPIKGVVRRTEPNMKKLPPVKNPSELNSCIDLLEDFAHNLNAFNQLPGPVKHSFNRAVQNFQDAVQQAERKKKDIQKRERKKNRRSGTKKIFGKNPKMGKAERKKRDRARVSQTQLHRQYVTKEDCSVKNPPDKLEIPSNCYICKSDFHKLHFCYSQLCPECGEFNYKKRLQSSDLSGPTALLTGGRCKIGYQTGLKILRAGAHLVVTTRFPDHAAMQYSKEPDFNSFKDRLDIYGLDLRHLPSVEFFTNYLTKNLSGLDIIINNAAQTIRHPQDFYRSLIASKPDLSAESKHLTRHYKQLKRELTHTPTHKDNNKNLLTAITPGNYIGITLPELLSQHFVDGGQHNLSELFLPAGMKEDSTLKSKPTWKQRINEVSTIELIEVQFINVVSPFLLISRLKPLMLKGKKGNRFIVNVTAVEGQFSQNTKNIFHPHTNMAKAALNMITRTSAADYARSKIYITSVDPGWVIDDTEGKHSVQYNHATLPPLDAVDGAARICDPIFSTTGSEKPSYGVLFKDYFPIRW